MTSSDCLQGESLKQTRRKKLLRVLYVTVHFRALLASKDLSEPRELQDERLDSKKRRYTSFRLFYIP